MLAIRTQMGAQSKMSYVHWERMLTECRLARSELQEEFSRERRARMAVEDHVKFLEKELKTVEKKLAKCKCGEKNEH